MSRPNSAQPAPSEDSRRLSTRETLDHFMDGLAPEPLAGLPQGVRVAAGVDLPRAAGQLLRQMLPQADAAGIVVRVSAILRVRPATEKPRWHADTKELRWLGVVVRSFRDDAVNQSAVLAAFEKAGWPPGIPDPLPARVVTNAKRRRWQTVQSLNRGMLAGTIRFSADGVGGFHWEAVA
jgi:hypothetical protein